MYVDGHGTASSSSWPSFFPSCSYSEAMSATLPVCLDKNNLFITDHTKNFRRELEVWVHEAYFQWHAIAVSDAELLLCMKETCIQGRSAWLERFRRTAWALTKLRMWLRGGFVLISSSCKMDLFFIRINIPSFIFVTLMLRIFR